MLHDLTIAGKLEIYGKCSICVLTKHHRHPYNIIVHSHNFCPFQLVHTDINGPINPVSHDGYKYFISFIDNYVSFKAVYFLKNRCKMFEKFQEYVE